jgi:large subunit ribosomal protein L13
MRAKTFMAKTGSIQGKWLHVDAADKILGRLAVRIATVLMGKHRVTYTPHVATGDFVIVTNASKVRVTGRKIEQKEYQRYSLYPGGLRRIPMKRMLERKPEEVLRLAVRRMLPKGSLGNHLLKRLKIYAGPEHPHAAQCPEEMPLPESAARARRAH